MEFPRKAALVPPDRPIVESLGWQAGTWGCFLLVLAVWAGAQKDALGLRLTAAGLSSAVSLVWTRHVWLTFRLPRPNGIYEDFNLPRGLAARMEAS